MCVDRSATGEVRKSGSAAHSLSSSASSDSDSASAAPTAPKPPSLKLELELEGEGEGLVGVVGVVGIDDEGGGLGVFEAMAMLESARSMEEEARPSMPAITADVVEEDAGSEEEEEEEEWWGEHRDALSPTLAKRNSRARLSGLLQRGKKHTTAPSSLVLLLLWKKKALAKGRILALISASSCSPSSRETSMPKSVRMMLCGAPAA